MIRKALNPKNLLHLLAEPMYFVYGTGQIVCVDHAPADHEQRARLLDPGVWRRFQLAHGFSPCEKFRPSPIHEAPFPPRTTT